MSANYSRPVAGAPANNTYSALVAWKEQFTAIGNQCIVNAASLMSCNGRLSQALAAS